MRIVPGVSYHVFDDKVYVHNVNNQKDYIFSDMAFDVLSYCKQNKDFSVQDICGQINKIYDIPDKSELYDDIDVFVKELLSENILYETENDDGKDSVSWEIIEEVRNSFYHKRQLFSLCLELTYRCSEKCIHCYIDDFSTEYSKRELSFDDYKSILKQAHDMGCVRILLTGGEVLLRKDLCDIAEYAVSLGLIVDVYTTGIGLTNEIFDRMCSIKLNSVSVSLYSGIASIHDNITKLPGSFEKTLKAAMMFKCAGITTFIKCVAIQQNFDSLESIYQLGKRLDLRVNVSPYIVSGHQQKKSCDYSLNEKQYNEFFLLDSKYNPVKPRKLNKNEIELILNATPCSAGMTSLSIDPFGNVRPCISFKKTLGTIQTELLKSIWSKANDPKIFQNVKFCKLTPQCATCKYIEFCHVCIAELFNNSDATPLKCGTALIMSKAMANAVIKNNL